MSHETDSRTHRITFPSETQMHIHRLADGATMNVTMTSFKPDAFKNAHKDANDLSERITNPTRAAHEPALLTANNRVAALAHDSSVAGITKARNFLTAALTSERNAPAHTFT